MFDLETEGRGTERLRDGGIEGMDHRVTQRMGIR
jgi:hypothetical protein